jgi:hypothetical protein
MAKFGQNDDNISLPRNSSVGMQFSGMIEDMMKLCNMHLIFRLCN